MISKRITSLYRRITVCLTLILFSLFFVLSCQKDEGLKQKDLNALTKAQAKEYFEQTASTLKFLTAGTIPAGTKNADYSLTENMIIDWDEALEGETVDSYVVEIPISMVCPVTALMYDGIGHFNKNIRQVQMNASLLIEKHKADGSLHYSVVTTVGSYSATVNSKYGFLCDKSSFSGYQIFSDEEGNCIKSFVIKNGIIIFASLIPQREIKKVDSCGKDYHFVGLSFCTSKVALTKGGGGESSGEDSRCPYCGRYLSITNGVPYCSHCEEFFEEWTFTICPDCLRPIYDCDCACPICGYPNRYGNTCMCEPGPFDKRCPVCGLYGCNGQHGGDADSTNYNNIDTYSVIVHTNLGGTVSRSIERAFYYNNEQLTLTALPNSGYYFVGWYENNALLSVTNQYSFNVTASRVIYAFFEEQ